MKSAGKKRLGLTLVLLILLSFGLSCWLLKTQKEKISIPFYNEILKMQQKPLNEYTNGVINQNLGFHMRQHGLYWVLYNYIRAEKEFKGNESITLVLHGEWMDVRNLTETLERWQGPIALTLFVNGDDFERARECLSYLRYCTMHGEAMRRLVNVNFIMHQDFLPRFIPRTEKTFFDNHPNCSIYKEFDFSQNYRRKRSLKYPSNLARNVGRLTADTYFVLSLDMEFIPSPNVPELFLEMLKTLPVDEPRKTVFVLPAFDLLAGSNLPESQSDFKFVDQQVLHNFLNSNSVFKIPNLREWLEVKENWTMSIFDQIQRVGPWLAFYISVNDREPFNDENDNGGDKQLAKMAQMDLLEYLDYDFYILNMAFVTRRIVPPHDYKAEEPLRNQTKFLIENQRNMLRYKELLMNFI